MQTAQHTLHTAGGREQLLADFTALSETLTLDGEAKYNERPTLEWLAKFICAQGGGPNKDAALYELVHLIAALHHSTGRQNLNNFFLSPNKASPAYCRHYFHDLGPNDLQIEKDFIRYPKKDGDFEIRFGRMPALIALYEFLCSMEGFGFFEDIQAICITLGDQKTPQTDDLKKAANAMAALLRKYRIAHIATQQAEGKFHTVFTFLQDRSEENRLRIADDDIFDFWSLHSEGKDFKGYRTVFDLFCDFTTALEECGARRAGETATRLGTDIENGEMDLTEDHRQTPIEEWRSPFNVFDQPELAQTRFFKTKSERKPFEALMNYGPHALMWPHAFIRYEIFGQVQAGITNDLQVGRGLDNVKKRISCEDLPHYQDRDQQLTNFRQHLDALQASCLHVLNQKSNVLAFPGTELPAHQTEDALEQAAKAYKKMNRKGFEADLDVSDEKYGAFQLAAGALISLNQQVATYQTLLSRRHTLDHYDEDKDKFSQQFHTLYKGVLS